MTVDPVDPQVRWREAVADDLAAVVSLLADDPLGVGREDSDLRPYRAAFDAMQAGAGNVLVVGETGGRVVACFQIALIAGLSRRAAIRAQVEGVRVASALRGRGLGRALMAEAERRARAGGATLMQLTSDRARDAAHAFYEGCGFTASHIGYKRDLS